MMRIFNLLKGIFSPVVESGQELLKFLGILKPVANSQSDTWKDFGKFLGRIAQIVIAVIAAFKMAAIVIGIVKAITGVVSLLNMTLLANPIVAIVTAFVLAGIYICTHWEEVCALFAKIWKNIAGFGKDAADWIKRKWQSFKNWWNTPMLSDWFVPVIGWAKISWNLVKRLWNKFWTWWNTTTLSDWFKPIKDFAVGAYDYVKGKWQEFCTWWDSLTLPDIFAALGGYIDKGIAYIKDKWNDFIDWLSSLNPFKSWTPPTVDPETAKAWKSEMLQKYGTLDLRPSYMRGEPRPNVEHVSPIKRIVSVVSKTTVDVQPNTISAEKLKKHMQDITVLNTMSRDFSQRVAEMTRAWQPFKDSLGAGFTEIYTTMQGISDRIRGVVIPAVNIWQAHCRESHMRFQRLLKQGILLL